MKNLGFNNLHLAAPTELGHLAAIRMLQGAEDILESAQIHETVAEAISSYDVAFATSHRMKRDEAIGLSQAAQEIASLARTNKVAIIFGSEKYGIAREDVDRCNRIITLPVEPDFPSANLAQAVGMVCVEIKLQVAKENGGAPPAGGSGMRIKLPIEKRQRFYDELYRLFSELDMEEPSVRQKIQAVFERANLDDGEMNLFYGMMKEIRRLKKDGKGS